MEVFASEMVNTEKQKEIEKEILNIVFKNNLTLSELIGIFDNVSYELAYHSSLSLKD